MQLCIYSVHYLISACKRPYVYKYFFFHGVSPAVSYSVYTQLLCTHAIDIIYIINYLCYNRLMFMMT